MVYDLEKEEKTELYGFEEKIRSCLYEDLVIDLEEMLR